MEASGRGSGSQTLRRRIWIETALATVTAAMALLTIVWPDWIEMIFRVDPDGGNGVLEWGLVGVSAFASLMFGLRARADLVARAELAGQEELAHQ
jgi:hypothetical protein